MTNKEAKEKLYMEWQKFLEDNIDYAGISDAYKMAFRALDEQETSRNMEEIEEVINCDADAETKCKMISNILAAKPHYFEKQELKIMKSCDTCKHDEPLGCPSFIHDRCYNYSEWEQVDGEYDGVYISYDLISRQAVIEAIYDMKNFKYRNDLEKVIKELPSVAIPLAEPKKGHWISRYDMNSKEGWYECDRCHTERAFNTDFCPDCGTDMRADRKERVIRNED